MNKFSISGFLALQKRKPIGDLFFSTTLFLARDEKRNSGTTLPPHVVTSLRPLFQYLVGRALCPKIHSQRKCPATREALRLVSLEVLAGEQDKPTAALRDAERGFGAEI